MIVAVKGKESWRSKVHLVLATGDLPATQNLAHHRTFNAKYGCRICLSTTTKVDSHSCFLDSQIILRSKGKFTYSNGKLRIRSAPVFCPLPSFNGPAYSCQNEMHLFGLGLGKILFGLVLVSLNKSYNSSV